MITNLKEVQIKKLIKRDIEQKLIEYKEVEKVAKDAQKQLTEWKEWIKTNIQPGVYGNMQMMIERCEVKEYVVKAGTRETLKVEPIK